jgi:hypothetical protein
LDDVPVILVDTILPTLVDLFAILSKDTESITNTFIFGFEGSFNQMVNRVGDIGVLRIKISVVSLFEITYGEY